jgi:type IX secretion system PorP/SprF family membrane protein
LNIKVLDIELKKMKKVKYLIALSALLWNVYVNAQQQVMFTQYMFNGLAINPAYAGSHQTVSMTALMRQQWTGLDGAPSTQTFSVHSPMRKERFSLGLLFLHDKIGVTNQNGIYGSYAYRIPISNKGKLAFGLQAGATFYNALFSKVSITDPTFKNDVRLAKPNVGFGVYYNTDRFYVGFSMPQLIQTTFDKNNPDSDSKLVRHYFASAGYVFDLGPGLKLKPNVLLKAVSGAPVELDLNMNSLFRDVLWVGLSWRTFDSFDAILQFQINDQFQVGYSYDFATTTELRRVNGGSHELMLNYRFTFNKSRLITPRYF